MVSVFVECLGFGLCLCRGSGFRVDFWSWFLLFDVSGFQFGSGLGFVVFV